MITPGEIVIHIERLSQRYQARVQSTRPQSLHQLFAGKTVAHMLQSVPLIFSVCRGAQSVAALRAAEQALAIVWNEHREQQRERLIKLEMLQEHLWVLLMELPPMLGLPRWQQAMAAISPLLQKSMQQIRAEVACLDARPVSSDARPQQTIPRNLQEVAAGIQSLIFAPSADAALSKDSVGVAGQLLSALSELDFELDKPLGVKVQPAVANHSLRALLEDLCPDQWRHEQVLPLADDEESGALARQHQHPWVQEWGEWVLGSRLAALLAETHELLALLLTAPTSISTDLIELAPADSSLKACSDIPPQANAVSDPGTRFGCAHVDTARGRLTCALTVTRQLGVSDDQQRIVQMLAMAPTDWHFSPAGVAASLLNQVPVDDRLLKVRAELLVKLINPCVGYRIDCNEDHHISASDGVNHEATKTSGAVEAGR